MDWKTVGIIANVSKPGAVDLLRAVKGEFERIGSNVMLEEATARCIQQTQFVAANALFEKSDLLVVLGGDGTLLEVIRDAFFPVPPILAINLGTLGFLTGAGPLDFQVVLEQMRAGQLNFSERTLLNVTVLRDGKEWWAGRALNEMVVSRGERSRLIRLGVDIDGEDLTEYNADGLIVATPTGSTAYSLSAGGPVLSPDSGVFVITPICPHVLTNRSLIINDRSVVTISSLVEQQGVCLTVDGREPLPLRWGDELRVGRSAETVRLVFPKTLPFFEVLRQKLRWSGKVV
jgi:NAD+ kinase